MGMRNLGTLGGRDYSFAYGINDAGQVVGQSLKAVGDAQHGFITGPNGTGMRDLGTLRGDLGNFSIAGGINDTGQVTGFSSAGNRLLPCFRHRSRWNGHERRGQLGWH